MQLEPNPSKGMKVRLNSDELSKLVGVYEDDPRKKIALRLMSDAGLRSFEVLRVAPKDVVRMDVDSNDEWKLRVWEGKGEKFRETYLPQDLKTELKAYSNAVGISSNEPVIDVSKRTLQRWVRTAASDVQEDTDDEGYQYVSTHDLRRSWGHLLIENDVLPTLVQQWGGWDDWRTFRDHYLGEHGDALAVEQAHKMFG